MEHRANEKDSIFDSKHIFQRLLAEVSAMGSLLEERFSAAILYLYGATSKKEFYLQLGAVLEELFAVVSFSVLVPVEESDLVRVDYSTETEFDEFRPPAVNHPAVHVALTEGEDIKFSEDERSSLRIGDRDLPIAAIKVLYADIAPGGLLVFHHELQPRDSGIEEDLQELIFDHAASGFRQVRHRYFLEERLEQRESRLGAVRQFGDVLGELDLERILSHLMAVCIRVSGAQVGVVALNVGEQNEVEWGLPVAALDRFQLTSGEPIVRHVVEVGEAMLVRDFGASELVKSLDDFHVTSFLSVPLMSKERALGTVNLVNADASRGGAFTEGDLGTVATLCSLAAPAIENVILHEELLKKERIEAGMQVARRIQRGMYPVAAFEVPGYELAWLSRSCDETGGDYFDFMEIDQERTAFVIGDVSGHGMGAALLMASGRANLRALLTVKSDLKEVVERLNDLLGDDMDEDKFMTLFLGRLDHVRHRVTFVNAGHDQPVFYSPSRERLEELNSTGTPLGMFAGWEYDLGEELDMEPGDLVFLSTDGVWEARNAERELFGKKRLCEILRETAEAPVADIVSAIVESVEGHLGATPAQDDLTLAVLRRTR